MAEFCLKCWNKMNGTNDLPKKYIISKDLYLCEGCGKWTNVIVMERKFYYLHKFRFLVLPFKIVYLILFILWKILIFPYVIYKRKRNKKRNYFQK